ncbi:MAG: GNAT family N-acetyltransferase [Oscillospiraceae bacterium]|nr:GNAT family N-acetyltransferase [Oscillospiraceae bacterium]
MERIIAVKRKISFEECKSFVLGFRFDNSFSDPMLSNAEQIKNNLIKAFENKENHTVIGIYKNREIIGLFSFLVLSDERYLEMLVGLSRFEEAYSAAFSYIKEHFSGYSADFVFNPNNYLLYHCLEQNGAEFYEEEQRMVFNRPAFNADTTGVELLSEAYAPFYAAIHKTDVYWTADRILESKDRFRTFIAIENGTVAGYLDVTCCHKENEIYDLWVREEYRRKGYGRKLLAKALEINSPNKMLLQVEIHNEAAIHLYESMGFEKILNQNSLTAHLQL